MAIDTRNADATERLLQITAIGDIPVRAYEPRPASCAVGVIRGVPQGITDIEILESVRQRTPARSARRMGTSEVIQIIFTTDTRPEYVILGYTRHQVYDYEEKPVQCTRCQRFGHIAGTCKRKLRCPRCGDDHELKACTSTEKRCPNCGRTHEADFNFCPTFRQERSIYRYKSQNKVDYKAAKAAVSSKKRSTRRDTTRTTEERRSQNTDFDFSEFPPLPPQTPDHVPQVPTPPTAPAAPRQHAWTRASQDRMSRQSVQPSTNSGSSILFLIDAVRSVLAPFTSPVTRAILTLLDTITPFLRNWL